jgi:hypothetical protein
MSSKTEIVFLTVGALKEFLKDIPDNYSVILSKDSEGNTFSPLSSDISLGHYKPDRTAVEGDFEFDEDEPSSIVFFPLN